VKAEILNRKKVKKRPRLFKMTLADFHPRPRGFFGANALTKLIKDNNIDLEQKSLRIYIGTESSD
jgi:hypothetical protein